MPATTFPLTEGLNVIGRFSSVVRALPWRQVQRDALGVSPPPASDGNGGRPHGGDTFRALRNRNYRLFFTGQAISLCGTWMQTIAQAWLVLEITDSKVALGTVTMLQFLPITIFVLFAGVIADRVPKRNFLVVTQSISMLQALLLALLVWTGQVELWHIYVLAFVLGLANAFEQPTRQAFVVEMVGKEDLMNAVVLNSGLFNGARLVGPAIGGFLIAAVGVKAAFLVNALSFMPVVVALLMMRHADMHNMAVARIGRINPIRELQEGLSYAFKTPSVLLIIILVAIIGTFGYNFTVMLPLLTKYVLDQGAGGLGFMTAAVGLGALISALFLASRKTASKKTLFVGAGAFGVLLGAVALSPSYILTLGLLLLLGLANTAFASTANTSLQLATPDHLRGRVMALYMLLFAGSTPIGGYLTGAMAEAWSVQVAVGIEAALCLIGVAAGLLYYYSHREGVRDSAMVKATAA
jgi:MFS family permease